MVLWFFSKWCFFSKFETCYFIREAYKKVVSMLGSSNKHCVSAFRFNLICISLYLPVQRRVQGYMPKINQISGAFIPSKYALDEIRNSMFLMQKNLDTHLYLYIDIFIHLSIYLSIYIYIYIWDQVQLTVKGSSNRTLR